MVDSNIVVSAILGFKSGPAIRRVGERFDLVISERGVSEVRSIVQRVAAGKRGAGDLAELYLGLMACPVTGSEPDLREAERALRFAVASRNGSTADAHVLALAWALDADIWSHDRDFAGTGWPSWSSANLLAYLADEAGELLDPS